MLKKIREYIETRMRYHNTVYELSKLSDAELKDIGINRNEIEFAAKVHSA